MNYGDLLIYFAFIPAIVGIISAILIFIFFQRHNIPANIIFWGFPLSDILGNTKI